MVELWTELMWLFIGEVFVVEICLNDPAVNQNSQQLNDAFCI
jgi:hypothetical protein